MHCPNYATCQLIHIPGFVEPENLRETFVQEYCTDSADNWINCKRFKTNNILHFCPDFVLPDTPLSIDEIMDRFDNDISQTNNTNNDLWQH